VPAPVPAPTPAVVTLTTPSAATIAAAATSWRAVAETDISVQSGGALDFSTALAGYDTRRMCTNWVLATAPLGNSASEAAALAADIRRRGYNMLRFHMPEGYFMRKGTTTDLDIDAAALDKFQRFTAELARLGINYSFDVYSNDNGYIGGVDQNTSAPNSAKLGVQLNSYYQSNWKGAVDKILTATNPYTGISTLRDPHLVMVIGVNEGGNAFRAQGGAFEAGLRAPWNTWLVTKYGSVSAWRTAWGTAAGSAEDPTAGSVALPPFAPSAHGMRAVDFSRFLTELETATATWMKAYLVANGFAGKFSSMNVNSNWEEEATRDSLDAVTINSYQDHPTGSEIGSTITHASAFDDYAAWLRRPAMSRYLDRPFYVTEASQVFWNRHRHEAGAMAGSMAALQGWDGWCSFGYAMDRSAYDPNEQALQYKMIKSFQVWSDPIAVANDRITALLFRRGDVTLAKNTLAVTSRPDLQRNISWLTSNWQSGWATNFARRSYLHRIGIIPARLTDGSHGWLGAASAKPAYVSDPMLFADDFSPTPRAAYAGYAPSTGLGPWYETAARMRESGNWLSAANLTDAPNDVLMSDTDELLYDFTHQSMRVATAKSEVAVFAATPLAGKLLTIESATPGATVGAFALDDKALTASSRILLMHLSDARNTGMTFTDATEKTLASWGTKPVLIRGSIVVAKLALPGSWTLYALDLRGNRVETRQVVTASGAQRFVLDTTGGSRPTLYYELVKN